jgi:hypothetical protein
MPTAEATALRRSKMRQDADMIVRSSFAIGVSTRPSFRSGAVALRLGSALEIGAYCGGRQRHDRESVRHSAREAIDRPRRPSGHCLFGCRRFQGIQDWRCRSRLKTVPQTNPCGYLADRRQIIVPRMDEGRSQHAQRHAHHPEPSEHSVNPRLKISA